ncbi:Hypothetical protein KLENKIAIHU_2732, partial [Klenkia terrae]
VGRTGGRGLRRPGPDAARVGRVRAARARAERRGGRAPGRRLRGGPAVREGVGERGGRRRGHGSGARDGDGLRRRAVPGDAGADRVDRSAGGAHRAGGPRVRGRTAGAGPGRRPGGRGRGGTRGRGPHDRSPPAARGRGGGARGAGDRRRYAGLAGRRRDAHQLGRALHGDSRAGRGYRWCGGRRAGGAGVLADAVDAADGRAGRARRRWRARRADRQRRAAALRRAGRHRRHQRRGLAGGRHRGGSADGAGHPDDGRLDLPRRRARCSGPLRHGQPDPPGSAGRGHAADADADPLARRRVGRTHRAGGVPRGCSRCGRLSGEWRGRPGHRWPGRSNSGHRGGGPADDLSDSFRAGHRGPEPGGGHLVRGRACVGRSRGARYLVRRAGRDHCWTARRRSGSLGGRRGRALGGGCGPSARHGCDRRRLGRRRTSLGGRRWACRYLGCSCRGPHSDGSERGRAVRGVRGPPGRVLISATVDRPRRRARRRSRGNVSGRGRAGIDAAPRR